jgi:hypothetical protein
MECDDFLKKIIDNAYIVTYIYINKLISCDGESGDSRKIPILK